MKKVVTSLFAAVTLFLMYISLSSNSGGITGLSSAGCNCHGASSSATTVTVTGLPTTFTPGASYNLTLTVTNTTKVGAGFNLKVSSGTLSSAPAGTAIIGGNELYHTSTQTMTGGTATWSFVWTAPTTASTMTLNVAGNAVNSQSNTAGDAWKLSSYIVQASSSSPLSVTAVAGSIACNGGTTTLTCTGSGGTMPYQYQLNSGAPTSNPNFTVGAGIYTVTIIDATNSTATTSVTINQPNPITPSLTVTHPLCFGANTGSINVTATGGTGTLLYKLNNGSFQPSGNFTGLGSGAYTITVQDANLCSTVISTTITSPSAIIPNITIQPSTCGQNYGSAFVVATGGTAPYTYWWTGGIAGDTATNLSAGTYLVIATDANNCTGMATATLMSPPPLQIYTTGATVCDSSATGLVTATVNGGVPPYNTVWSTGVVGNAAPPGTYTVTVTDNSGCTATETAVVSVINPPLNASFNIVNDTILVATTGGALTYQWFKCNPFQIIMVPSAPTYIANTPGDYGLIVSNGNCSDTSQCQTVGPSSIINIDKLSISINVTNNVLHISNFGRSNLMANIYSLNGAKMSTFELANGNQSLDVSGWRKGIYLLNIQGSTIKFTVE